MKRFVILLGSLIFFPLSSFATPQSHKPASSLSVVVYARNLLYTLVDSNFRGSWVITPETKDKIEQTTQKMQKSFESLSNVKIGSSQENVRETLGKPQEAKNNEKIWIYGTKAEDGTYSGLLEVFFDDKLQRVIGIISFNPKNIVEKIGVNIGDPIDKIISVYGEPLDEKDFIEDPDNKEYLGLYYLYPRSGIGFLVGQEKSSKNLLVHGILVYGKL